ncbi:hypothetical protein BKD26_08720 [Streptomyces sp. CB03238]|nr:hypothetical protein BKD26_08720 [Streptomyces sp. CB03238]
MSPTLGHLRVPLARQPFLRPSQVPRRRRRRAAGRHRCRDYMNDRYGSPCGAWNFWQANGWY